MVFLPALTLCTVRLIDKTRHRRLMPNLKNVNKVFSKLAVPALILVILVVVPAFLGRGRQALSTAQCRPGESDAQKRKSRKSSGSHIMAACRGATSRRSSRWEGSSVTFNHVTAVVSYANMVGAAYPPEFWRRRRAVLLDHYARIGLTDTPAEGDAAFGTVEEIMAVARSYYGDTVYSVGESANLLRYEERGAEDNRFVTILAVIAIFLVLLVTFKRAPYRSSFC